MSGSNERGAQAFHRHSVMKVREKSQIAYLTGLLQLLLQHALKRLVLTFKAGILFLGLTHISDGSKIASHLRQTFEKTVLTAEPVCFE